MTRCPSCGAQSLTWSTTHARTCELYVDPLLDAPSVLTALAPNPEAS